MARNRVPGGEEGARHAKRTPHPRARKRKAAGSPGEEVDAFSTVLTEEMKALERLLAPLLAVSSMLASRQVNLTHALLTSALAPLGVELTSKQMHQLAGLLPSTVSLTHVPGPDGEQLVALRVKTKGRAGVTNAQCAKLQQALHVLLANIASTGVPIPEAAPPHAGEGAPSAEVAGGDQAVLRGHFRQTDRESHWNVLQRLDLSPAEPLTGRVASRSARKSRGLEPPSMELQQAAAQQAEVTGPPLAPPAGALSSPVIASTLEPLAEGDRVGQAIRHIMALPLYSDQVVHCEVRPQRLAEHGHLATTLAPRTQAALESIGVAPDHLWAHQGQAIDAVRGGKHVLVSTSTASGKSLVYLVPTLEMVATNDTACAIYIFPTKALAQDQLRSVRRLLAAGVLGARADTLDGDTPMADRDDIRTSTRVVLTNPDILHVTVMPSHSRWGRLLQNLQYIVVDEVHTYHGTFGSHVACILRRLRRLAMIYGAHPQLICCSATIGNPVEHCSRLTGVPADDIVLVSRDASPRARTHFALWNPPVRAALPPSPAGQRGGPPAPSKEASRRMSSNIESAVLFAELVRLGMRTICFCSVRKIAELVLDYAKRHLRYAEPELVQRVTTYRGGLSARDRRAIEESLFDGSLLGVCATSTLELGVDIASLDAVLINGWPGSVSSLWQRAGRAGRDPCRPALIVYLGYASPIDQYYMARPGELFSKAVEHAVINPFNPQVLRAHLLCAARESPLQLSAASPDARVWTCGPEGRGQGGAQAVVKAVAALHSESKLLRVDIPQGGNVFRADALAPVASDVNVRSMEQDRYSVIAQAGGALDRAAGPSARAPRVRAADAIDEVEAWRILYELYEGAVYLNQGSKYCVVEVDRVAKVIAVRLAPELKYYTRGWTEVEVTTVGRWEERAVDDGVADPLPGLHYGPALVATSCRGYYKIHERTGVAFDEVCISMPDYQYDTFAAWIDIEADLAKRVSDAGLSFRAGVHAAAHGMVAMLPLVIGCEPAEVGVECPPSASDMSRHFPLRLLLFDKGRGGLGIAKEVYTRMAAILRATHAHLQACGCSKGCVCCTHSPFCTEYNARQDKEAAVLILEALCPPSEA